MNWEEQDNVRLVHGLYAAFGKGDIPQILDTLDPSVEWVQPGERLPWGGSCHGREEVSNFFEVLCKEVQYSLFEAQEFIAQADQVVVMGYSKATVKAGGIPVEQTWAMMWTIRDRKVTNYRYFDDTAKWVTALQAR